MNTRQRVRLNMLLTVRNCVTQNEAVAKKVPKFMDKYLILQSTTNEIQEIGKLQSINKTGVAADKNKLKKSLIALAAKNSRKIAALAKTINSDKLLNEAKYNEAQLERFPETGLLEQVMTIYSCGEENIASLTEYGITAETQKVFMDNITALNNALKTPRSTITERKKLTERLAILFQSTDEAIELMDYAVGSIADEQVDFANEYKAARKLVETNSGIVSLKAKATDLTNGAPLPGVLFTFSPDENSDAVAGGNGKLIKKTAGKGSFQIKNMKAGTYRVLVQKPGYKRKELSVSVSDGERSDLKVALEKP
jgi:hypothetical protein